MLNRRVQQFAALTAENIRLRALLNSSSLVEDGVIVAEIIGADPDPDHHEVILNQGQNQGVQVNQPVLDEFGLMGQIISVSANQSRAILISDKRHAIPVQVNRNGVRAIIIGEGLIGRLVILHVPNTADIAIGDLLVSSGLGGRFPFGYPVAEIETVNHDPGLPFATVTAKPKAQLSRSRHVLVVLKQEQPLNDQPTLK